MVETMEIQEGFAQTEVGVIPSDWEVKKLGDLSNMKSGENITSKTISELDIYPCYGGNGLRGYTHKFTHNGDFALIGRQGALCGNVQYVKGKFFASEHAVVVTTNKKTDIKWLFYMMTDMNLNQYSESSAQPGLSVAKILDLTLPLPPHQSRTNRHCHRLERCRCTHCQKTQHQARGNAGVAETERGVGGERV